MRLASPSLQAFLNNPANLSCVQVDLYTFALVSGETLRWSGGDLPLTIPSAGFPAGSINRTSSPSTFIIGPAFGRSKVTNKIGVEPAELDIDILAGPNDLIGTFTIAEAVRLGFFDGATVELDRFFAPPQASGSGGLDTSLGCLLWFYGRVAEADVGRSKITMKVKSLMNLLAVQQMPRRLYGAGCSHVFGDKMCGYDRVGGHNALGVATGAGALTVTVATPNQSGIYTVGPVPSYYAEGTATGLTGANRGVVRFISGVGTSPPVLGLKQALLFPPANGDTFQILPGCDHTVVACEFYQNILRFGGMPYIPPPEFAI